MGGFDFGLAFVDRVEDFGSLDWVDFADFAFLRKTKSDPLHLRCFLPHDFLLLDAYSLHLGFFHALALVGPAPDGFVPQFYFGSDLRFCLDLD